MNMGTMKRHEMPTTQKVYTDGAASVAMTAAMQAVKAVVAIIMRLALLATTTARAAKIESAART
jgi:hypothetical protein